MSEKSVKSMTGYGKSEQEIEGKKITVELRSLNSKQMDLSVRMPSMYREKEFAIRNEVTKRLQRGKVELSINVENINSTNTVPINTKAFKGYFTQLNAIASEIGLDSTKESLVSAILRLPDVVQADKVEVDEAEWKALDRAVSEAITNIEKFRHQEGMALMKDLLERVSKIEALKNSVIPFEKERIEVIKKRIRENIENMSIAVEVNRFEQEMIFYLEKLDITEEKIRLQNHCDYFREVAREEEAAGRKLGFITQEMGREINTLGSKANDSNIQRFVVQMKDELEKIKEQVLNLL